MVYRYKKKQRKPRRRFHRRYKRYKAIKALSNANGPRILPDTFFTKLTKSQKIHISLANDSFGKAVGYNLIKGNDFYNGNNPVNMLTPVNYLEWDVPAGLEQWTNIYQYYRIFKSTIRVEFEPFLFGTVEEGVDQDIGEDVPIVGIMPVIDPSTVSRPMVFGYEELLDQVTCHWQTRNGGPGARANKITNSMLTKKIFGQSITQDDKFKGYGIFDSNIAEINFKQPVQSPWYWYIFAGTAGADDSTYQNGVSCMVTVTYYVRFEGRDLFYSYGQTGPTAAAAPAITLGNKPKSQQLYNQYNKTLETLGPTGPNAPPL